ncbi:TonB-dependent receptor [Horticoccus sp. 23ND18S-11]|uniref:TonB-dependent receptor n=1 Tax=Horticoccus sp. 23ND18S-11 TaxID=3391832 RepID=UPI0039C8F948
MQIPTRILLIVTASAAFTCASAQTLTAPPPGKSAPGSPLTLEEVRVTADLWSSPLDRIPASVSVFDEPALRGGAVTHFGDLIDQIPNLTWSGGTSRPRYLQIRGIGENSQYEGETPDSTVRFLVDDLDFTGLGSLGGTFDLRQVEILRGPQAGAFGANAAGGVVRLVTNAPTPYWTGQVEATAGGDDLRAGGFAFGGPLIARRPEALMGRLAVYQHRSDGFRRNVTLNRDTNARDEFTARLRLTWNPAPAWRWDGAVLFSDVNNGFDEFALDNNGRRTFSDQPGRDEQRSTAASLRGTYTGLAGVRVSTVTSGSWVDSVYSYDDDWTAASYQGFSDLRRDRSVISEEVRFDSAATRAALGWIDRWTLGAYYARTDEDSAYTNEDPGNLRGMKTRYDARHAAVFGQVAHDFTASTRLTLGLRAEQLDLDGRGTRTRFRKSRGTFDPVVTFRPDFKDTLPGGKITLEHELDGNRLVFASVTRGYKGGGINVDARISPPADPLTYDTEYLWNYEVGLRGNWLEQRLTGEVTAFYLQRRDTQVRDSAGFGGSYRFFTANANRASVHGLEASGAFALTKPWAVFGSLALMNSSLDRFTLTNGNTGGGRRLANTPRHGTTVGTRYRAASGWNGQIEVVSRASQFDSNNQNEARRAFSVLNASVGYTWGAWSATLWARNMTDARYQKRVFFFGNEDPDYVETRYEDRADPRQVGVTAAYRF